MATPVTYINNFNSGILNRIPLPSMKIKQLLVSSNCDDGESDVFSLMIDDKNIVSDVTITNETFSLLYDFYWSDNYNLYARSVSYDYMILVHGYTL